MSIDLLHEAQQRPLAERLRLIEVVSGDLVETMRGHALTAAQRATLHARMVERLADPDSVCAWREVLAGIADTTTGLAPGHR